MTAHRIENPPGLAPARGFSHAVAAAVGTLVYLGGQTGTNADGGVVDGGLVAQFDQAATNVVAALEAVGGRPGDIVQLLVYTTDLGEYRRHLRELGEIHRRHFGRHYPAMALFEVSQLFDAAARVELVGTAVVAAR